MGWENRYGIPPATVSDGLIEIYIYRFVSAMIRFAIFLEHIPHSRLKSGIRAKLFTNQETKCPIPSPTPATARFAFSVCR